MTETKYFLYTRKSSEDKARQVASIGDQVDAIEKMVRNEGLNLVETFSESKSAKAPGRPIFSKMLDKIEKGEADGVLCWDIDRLYRNPVDEGRLRWMLQKGVIKTIRTPYRSFFPDDAGLLMGVEGGRATDYVIRLSKNVKRGLEGKVRKGWKPGPTPPGYMNEGLKGEKIIVRDLDRFDLVKQMWELMLTGTYTPAEIREIAVNEWGLTNQQKRYRGGKPIGLSQIYKIFHNPFYCGYFNWKNAETGEYELLKGAHEPMVTQAEFDRIQLLIGNGKRMKAHSREFAFTGLINCGECQSKVTAETKDQCICDCKHKFSTVSNDICSKCQTAVCDMKNPKLLSYTYYRCSKKAGPCSQKYISDTELEKQIDSKLAEMTLDEQYLDLALEYLRETNEIDHEREAKKRVSIRGEYDEIDKQIQRLSDAYLSVENKDGSLFSDTEFKEQKKRLMDQRSTTKQRLDNSEGDRDKALELSEKVFRFCVYARHHFDTDDLRVKRSILSTIGSNLILKDKELSILALPPYLMVEKFIAEQKAELGRLEPKNNSSTKGSDTVLATSIPQLRRVRDSNPWNP